MAEGEDDLLTFLARLCVSALPHSNSGSIAAVTTICWFRIDTVSAPGLQAIRWFTTKTPFAPPTPTTINFNGKKKTKDDKIYRFFCFQILDCIIKIISFYHPQGATRD